eukprot:Gb_30689 [translate_table: standard]
MVPFSGNRSEVTGVGMIQHIVPYQLTHLGQMYWLQLIIDGSFPKVAMRVIKPSPEDGYIELQNTGGGVALRVENIEFSYKNSRKVLQGVSFSADRGESIAIVGSSGSGKSTIVKLLLRLYDPDCGTLFIDGHDLCSLTKVTFLL